MGPFIVFEGGEGAGKSTQARGLYRRLSGDGRQVVLVREPGGSALGDAVRRWVKTRSGLTPTTELLLFLASRAQLVEEVIRPALGSQKVVVSDRFSSSTVAYQGYGRGIGLELITRLNEVSTGGLCPDLTVFMDMPVEQGLARKSRDRQDIFEAESVKFHRRVREGYLAMASEERERWLVVDATRKRSVLGVQIWAAVQPLLPKGK